MKFTNYSELLTYVESLGQLDRLEFDILLTEDITQPCVDCKIEEQIKSVKIKNLYESPNIDFIIDNTSEHNILVVESFEKLDADGCFTGKINMLNRIVHCSICESDGLSKLTLMVDVDGSSKDIQFVLREGTESSVILNPKLI